MLSKLVLAATAVSAAALPSMATEKRQTTVGATYDYESYYIPSLYAGSGPKSSFTDYSFDVGLSTGSGAAPTYNTSCSAVSGTDNHDGTIATLPTTNCSSTYPSLYQFSWSMKDKDTYYFNVSDLFGGHGSYEIAASYVVRVQNNANPGEPDPFPNYQTTGIPPFSIPRSSA